MFLQCSRQSLRLPLWRPSVPATSRAGAERLAAPAVLGGRPSAPSSAMCLGAILPPCVFHCRQRNCGTSVELVNEGVTMGAFRDTIDGSTLIPWLRHSYCESPLEAHQPIRQMIFVSASAEVWSRARSSCLAGSTLCESLLPFPPTTRELKVQRSGWGGPSWRLISNEWSSGRGPAPVRCRGTLR